MARGKRVEWAAIEHAAVDRVVHRRDLIALGVAPATLHHRCAGTKIWRRVLPGVVLLSNATPTWRHRVLAALSYAGPNAMVTGLAALRWHGLRRLPSSDRVHLLIPDTEQRATHDYVVVERTTRLPVAIERDHLRIAPVTRAVLDAARRLTDADEVCALIAEAVQRGFTTARELRAELAAGSDRGSRIPRQVLTGIDDGIRSVAELDARRLVRRRFPAMRWNVPIADGDGTPLGVVDGWLDDLGVAWEIDSYEFHLSPKHYARTLERRARMTAAGIVVAHSLPSTVRRSPARALAELEGAVRLARQRPRPPVIVFRRRAA